MPESINPVYYQIISHMILDPKSYGILKEFFGALDKYEFEYEAVSYTHLTLPTILRV